MNLEKLDEAIAWIEAHPEDHSQSSYFARGSCGTTACLAGTVAVLAGWRPDWTRPDWSDDPGAWETTGRVRRAGAVSTAWDVAAEVLDIDPRQATDLFIHAGDLEDIKRIRDECAAGER